MKYTDESQKISHADGLRIYDGDGYRHGEVATEHGFVAVYSEGSYAVLHFAYRGRWYTRTFRDTKRVLSRLSLTRLAAKFAREIAQGEEGAG